jgi:hypothetical protein
LLSDDFHWVEKDELEKSTRAQHRADSVVAGNTTTTINSINDDGFLYALAKIDEQHGLNTSKNLIGLSQFLHPIDLSAGEVLQRHGMDDNNINRHGIYFIEIGLLRVEIETAAPIGSISAFYRSSVGRSNNYRSINNGSLKRSMLIERGEHTNENYIWSSTSYWSFACSKTIQYQYHRTSSCIDEFDARAATTAAKYQSSLCSTSVVQRTHQKYSSENIT